MSTLKKYDLTGKATGEVSLDKELLKESANPQMIKDYIVAIRHNARQWSANTKGRSEINATKKKPHPQKGLGRARQGNFSSPQYKGGGIVFGPKPKFDQNRRINKKEKRAAIRSLFAGKVKSKNVHVLACSPIEAPKTKTVAQFLEKVKLQNKRVLFLGPVSENGVNPNTGLIKSMKNIPRVEFMQTSNINGYDLSLAEDIVLLDAAVDEFIASLG